jgi:hypothetical protein
LLLRAKKTYNDPIAQPGKGIKQFVFFWSSLPEPWHPTLQKVMTELGVPEKLLSISRRCQLFRLVLVLRSSSGELRHGNPTTFQSSEQKRHQGLREYILGANWGAVTVLITSGESAETG